MCAPDERSEQFWDTQAARFDDEADHGLRDPVAAVAAWTRLPRTGGRLILIEGCWSTGAGLTAERCREIVLTARHTVKVEQLNDPDLWGKTIDDERYLLVSSR